MNTTNTETLKSYAKAFRDHKYRSETNRSLFHFFKFLVLVMVFFTAQYFLQQVAVNTFIYGAIALMIAFFQGLTYLSLWLIGHDCGHNSFSNNQKLNQWVGSISTSFMLMNYENFRRSHNMHHSFVGNIEKMKPLDQKPKDKISLSRE